MWSLTYKISKMSPLTLNIRKITAFVLFKFKISKKMSLDPKISRVAPPATEITKTIAYVSL